MEQMAYLLNSKKMLILIRTRPLQEVEVVVEVEAEAEVVVVDAPFMVDLYRRVAEWALTLW